MAESNESLNDILDAFLETSASNQLQIHSNTPPSVAETLDHPDENFDYSQIPSSLRAIFQGLEFLNSLTSSDHDVDAGDDSMVDVSSCVQKNLTGYEAEEFLKNFRRPTPDFKFPLRDHPRRQRAQHKWLVFISHIFIYSFLLS